jgi:hypothetical protein
MNMVKIINTVMIIRAGARYNHGVSRPCRIISGTYRAEAALRVVRFAILAIYLLLL